MQDKLLLYKKCLLLLLFIAFFSISCAFSQSNTEFTGLWIRKVENGEKFDPFMPDFVMIDKLEKNYLVVFLNSVVVDDTLMSEFIHHIYRKDGDVLVNEMIKYSSSSTLKISTEGLLIESILIPGSSEGGENFYVRPSQSDFQLMIDWYGYKLN